MFRPLALGALVLGSALTPGIAADTSQVVQFQSGGSSAIVDGSLTGSDYADYILGARKGQTMSVRLTDNGGTIYFNILPPGSRGEAIYNGSMGGNSATVTLPQDGDYTVRTYLMGNDRDTGQTVSYSLQLGIE